MREANKLGLAKAVDIYGGTGKPELTVVMIHGIAANAGSFAGLVKFLTEQKGMQKVRLIAFDLLGAGKSTGDEALEYNFAEQTQALRNAITEAEIAGPIVLMGHSMGTLIVTRYADAYPGEIAGLVLISPPIYTEKDLDNPAMKVAIRAFEDTVRVRQPELLETKAFRNSMQNIVLARDNATVLARAAQPTVLIYGELDQIIGAFNIPNMLKENPNLTAVRTAGRHGVSRDKYASVLETLEKFLEQFKNHRKEA